METAEGYYNTQRTEEKASRGPHNVRDEVKKLVVAAIPAYNEEQTIAKVLIHTGKHVDKILVVDDGSSDETGLISEKLGAAVIRHERNLGKGPHCGRASIGQGRLELMSWLPWTQTVSMTQTKYQASSPLS